uniref:Phosphopyruvate hydratase n=1 Tax=Heterorhabditis bacteriophora TaxID=37862 RepID=A0A1I7WSG4_HETBA
MTLFFVVTRKAGLRPLTRPYRGAPSCLQITLERRLKTESGNAIDGPGSGTYPFFEKDLPMEVHLASLFIKAAGDGILQYDNV